MRKLEIYVDINIVRLIYRSVDVVIMSALLTITEFKIEISLIHLEDGVYWAFSKPVIPSTDGFCIKIVRYC